MFLLVSCTRARERPDFDLDAQQFFDDLAKLNEVTARQKYAGKTVLVRGLGSGAVATNGVMELAVLKEGQIFCELRSDDRERATRLKFGDRVAVKGVVKSYPSAGWRPAKVHMEDCTLAF